MDKSISVEAARICGKIERALTSKAADLRIQFNSLDPNRCGHVSDTNFFIVLYKFVSKIGITREDIDLLAEYFEKDDHKVCYKEFLEVVETKVHSGKPFVTGLEWEDHQQINVLTPFETRHLNLILTKIAYSCQLRNAKLAPHFQVKIESCVDFHKIDLKFYSNRITNELLVTTAQSLCSSSERF